MNFYIYTSGGAGDLIKNYFWGKLGWQYTTNIKQNPNNKIKLITASSNPVAHDLFKHHPHVDEIVHLPWQNPNLPNKELHKYTNNFTNLETYAISQKNIKPILHKRIYLSDKDKETINSLSLPNKYIVLHPFLGTNRKPATVEQMYFLAKTIVKEINLPLIILGGNHDRFGFTHNPGLNEESFPYQEDGIINLVNKTNLRIGAEITRKAIYFTGTNSCFYCVRLGLGQPAVVLINNPQTQKNPILSYPKSNSYWLATTGKTTIEETIKFTAKAIKDYINIL